MPHPRPQCLRSRRYRVDIEHLVGRLAIAVTTSEQFVRNGLQPSVCKGQLGFRGVRDPCDVHWEEK